MNDPGQILINYLQIFDLIRAECEITIYPVRDEENFVASPEIWMNYIDMTW